MPRPILRCLKSARRSGSVGFWALGSQGVGCLGVNISTTVSPIRIQRPDLASLGPTLSSPKRACGSGVVGFWALGALWALGDGRWVARALGVQTRISRRRGVRSRLRDPPWHRPGPQYPSRAGLADTSLSVLGRWVAQGHPRGVGSQGVGCLNVNIPTTGRPIPIPRPDLASPRLTLGTPKRAGLYLAAGFWALGAEGVG